MNAKDESIPAFPIPPNADGDHDWNRAGGMSLRDYFAGQALNALVASALAMDHQSWAATAQHAYVIADAMLAERAK